MVVKAKNSAFDVRYWVFDVLRRSHDSDKVFLHSTFLSPALECSRMSQSFTHTLRVTYAHCTVGNHIYYARYLDLLETARGEFFRSLGIPFLQLQEQDTIFPVVEVHVRYKAPARYDDVLNIEVWLTELGKIRMNFGYRILNQNGTLLLDGETWHVCTTLAEKPKRLPDDIAARLRDYVVTPAAPPGPN